jgi:hypothetical protein
MTDPINDNYLKQFTTFVEKNHAEIADALSAVVANYEKDYKRNTRKTRTPQQAKIRNEITRLGNHLCTAKTQDRGRVLLGYTLQNKEQLPKEFTELFNAAQKLELPFFRYSPLQNFKYLVENKGMHVADALLEITQYYFSDYQEKQNPTQQDNIYRELYVYLKIVKRDEDQFLLSYRFLHTLPADFMEMVEAARARELMMQYDHLVRDQKNNIVNALLAIVDNYSSAYVHRQTRQGEKDEVCVELDRLKAHLKAKPKVGEILLGYTFQHAMPQDFIQMLEAVKGLEQERVDLIRTAGSIAPSFLVSKSENVVAASCYSVEALFAETAKLEEALRQNERNPKANLLSLTHKSVIGNKIQIWTNDLSQKIAELMIKANSAKQLTRLIEEKLSDDLISSTFGLADLKAEILSQIEYLGKHAFFKPGYSKLRLADKYQYVQDFSLQLKNKNPLPQELEATLLTLLEAIELKAYASLQKKKNQLMELPEATTDYVFAELESSLNLNGMQFRKSNLFNVLKERLQKEKEQWEAWEEVITAERNPYRTYSPLMREIHCMKYTYTIGQDPKALLPQKPVIIHAPKPTYKPSSMEEIEGAEFLVCDWEDDQDQDKENQNKKNKNTFN